MLHAIGMQLSLPRDLAKTPFLKADQQQKEKKKKHLLQEGKIGKLIPCGRSWYLFSYLLKVVHALWRPQVFQKMASVLCYFYLFGLPLKFALVCRKDH